jgi:tetratricopeptide (TPR) repeat protein
MNRDSVAFALSGILFGLLVGWIIGAQQGSPAAPPAVSPTAAAAAPQEAPPPFDAARATTLERQAAAEPSNADLRVALGDLYYDAQRYAQAATWYEAALKLDPKNVNASTDLGVAYFSLDQVDRALAQFDRSLEIDPRHTKTLLNQGIVRAFGKQDLTGAADSWQKVVDIAPDSEEGKRARQGLDGLRNAHEASTSGTRTGGSQP